MVPPSLLQWGMMFDRGKYGPTFIIAVGDDV